MHRRHFLKAGAALAGGALLAPLGAGSALAEPIRSLDIFVPGAPGGGWDIAGRLVGEVMRSEKLISRSRITNAGGAGGTIGLSQFINQYAGEGEAVFVAGAFLIGASIANKAPVDLRMLTPLARLMGEYQVLVVPAASPIQTLPEFIAALKADPKSISWAGGAKGGLDHIFASMIAREAGVAADQLSYVTFTGGGESSVALLGNQVSCGLSGHAEFAEQIAAGNLRALGLSAPSRVAGIDVPTLKEQGIDVVLSNWRGLFGAPDLDATATAQLVEAVTGLATSAGWAEVMKARGWDDQFLPTAQFAAFIEQDTATMRGVLHDLGLA